MDGNETLEGFEYDASAFRGCVRPGSARGPCMFGHVVIVQLGIYMRLTDTIDANANLKRVPLKPRVRVYVRIGEMYVCYPST